MTECSSSCTSHTVEAGLFSIPLLTNWLMESCSYFIRPKHQSSENLLIITGWENKAQLKHFVLKHLGEIVSVKDSFILCVLLFLPLIQSGMAHHQLKGRAQLLHDFTAVLQCWESAVHSHSHPASPWSFPQFRVSLTGSGPAASCTAADRAVARAGPRVSVSLK